MKKTIFSIGLVASLLGTLWLLQGLGIVHIRPILCFAQCDAVQAPSTTWAVVGAVALAVGVAVMFGSVRRRAT